MSSRPMFDDKDAELLAVRQQAWDKREGPRVGDFIEMVDGTLRRFTYNWDDGLQTTWGDCRQRPGSFYLSPGGHGSYSGALDSTVPLGQIESTESTQEGQFWFFHHDYAVAHGGVYVTLLCRVYRQKAEAELALNDALTEREKS